MEVVRTTVFHNIDARDLEVLLVVAETGSFRSAGLQLELGQSAVSRRVQKLEELLGVSLFERCSTGARMTFAGAQFVARSGAIFENLKAAVWRAQALAIAESGMLRIGTMSSFSNGPHRALIASFLEQHPSVRLSFVETERRQMMTMLSHRALDVVIAVGNGLEAIGSTDILPVWETMLYLAVPSDSSLAEAESLRWSEIVDAEFLISAREAGPDIHDLIVRRATTFGHRANISRHQLSREGIMGLVGLGLGVTVVGDHAAGAIYPNVKLVPLAESEAVPFSISWRSENDNPALRRFVSLARSRAQQRPVSGGAP